MYNFVKTKIKYTILNEETNPLMWPLVGLPSFTLAITYRRRRQHYIAVYCVTFPSDTVVNGYDAFGSDGLLCLEQTTCRSPLHAVQQKQ